MPPHLDLDHIRRQTLPPQKSTQLDPKPRVEVPKAIVSCPRRPVFSILPICAFEMVFLSAAGPLFPSPEVLDIFLHHVACLCVFFNENKQRILERLSVSFDLFFGGNVANWHAQETYQKMPTAHENLRRGVCHICQPLRKDPSLPMTC